MLHFRQAILQIDEKTYLIIPGRANSFPELYVDFQEITEKSGRRFTIFLHPKQDIQIRNLEIQFDLQLGPTARFFANGFQSWSESRTYHPHEKIPRLRSLARRRIGFYGDEHIAGIPKGEGYLHSWTYTTVAERGLTRLLGSLNESTGFTLFMYDQPNAVFTVRKDLAGLQLSHSFPALDFWEGEGFEQELFERWFELLRENTPSPFSEIPLPANALGWTSWYRHFTHISGALLLEQLDHVAESGLPFRYFQIDDGWQTAVGDWFSVKKTFPDGMGKMAAAIQDRGLIPGIWVAPFVASAKSELVKQHPDWLLRDQKGRLLRAGWNPIWGGWYHALNFYHPKVQEYLSGVFHVMTEKWGYRLFKLDFLFAVCLAPPTGKTRGQVMWDAMEFLRKQLGDNAMLACGAPLGSAFGHAAFCRIGGDIHLAWEHRLLAWLRLRERVSTVASLRSTLGRWLLDGRAFGNDPDVFILRKEEQGMTQEQQHTVLTMNALLGSLLFTSDDIGRYTTEQKEALRAALALRESKVSMVRELEPDFYRIDFARLGEVFRAYVNLNAKPRRFQTKNGWTEVRPFETRVFSKEEFSDDQV